VSMFVGKVQIEDRIYYWVPYALCQYLSTAAKTCLKADLACFISGFPLAASANIQMVCFSRLSGLPLRIVGIELQCCDTSYALQISRGYKRSCNISAPGPVPGTAVGPNCLTSRYLSQNLNLERNAISASSH
jgi:hypothetical protein